MIALVAWAVVGILGFLRVDVDSRVLPILLLTEISIILVYDFADLANTAGGDITFDRTTRLRTESEGARLADASLGRRWRVSNPSSTNRLGQPVAYELRPEGPPVLLADDSSGTARRAAFARKHLWVTRYDPAERYPAGDLINQHPGVPACPSSWRRTGRSKARTSSCGTRSVRCASRAPRTGRSCRSSHAGSPSSRWASLTATRRWTFPPGCRHTAIRTAPAPRTVTDHGSRLDRRLRLVEHLR